MIIKYYRNLFLNHLAPETVNRLQLRPIKFSRQHELEFPGLSIERLVFLEEGLACMTTTFEDGSQVEAGMFGYDSVIGISALMGTTHSFNRVYTQIGGFGYTCTIDVANAEFNRGGDFHRLALSHIHAQLVQANQSSGCNARHTINQRLSRCLLTYVDRTNRKDIKTSHESLAEMIGSTRPTVSLEANNLRRAGLIEYRRGVLSILDIPGLEKMTCECYRVVKDLLVDYRRVERDILTQNYPCSPRSVRERSPLN